MAICRIWLYVPASGSQPAIRQRPSLLIVRTTLPASSPEGISYSTAISAIIACPYKLRSGEEARALHKVFLARPSRRSASSSLCSNDINNAPQVGEKLALKVDEFLQTGRIKEAGMPCGRYLLVRSRAHRLRAADDLQHNERYQALKSLMTVHGIGHHTAKELYALGYRSAEDMRKSGKWETEFKYHDDIQLPYVGSHIGIATAPTKHLPPQYPSGRRREHRCFRPTANRPYRTRCAHLYRRRVGLSFHGSAAMIGALRTPSQTVRYRRGKLQSNDVDLLIT